MRNDGKAASVQLPAPQAIVFDCYDTLFDNSQSYWKELFHEIAAEQRLPIPGAELYRDWKRREVEFRKRRVNMRDQGTSPPFISYETAWTQCFASTFEAAGLNGDAVAAARRAVEHMGARPLFPDTLDALESLQGRCRMGIFSNADDAFLLPLLASLKVEWAAVASSESAGVYKPLTGAFAHVAGLLNVEPPRTWYVGDHLFDDVLGSNLAGMVSIWINRDGSRMEVESAPDAEISDLRDLVPLLASSKAKTASAAPVH